jgi:hypothetical protein
MTNTEAKVYCQQQGWENGFMHFAKAARMARAINNDQLVFFANFQCNKTAKMVSNKTCVCAGNTLTDQGCDKGSAALIKCTGTKRKVPPKKAALKKAGRLP